VGGLPSLPFGVFRRLQWGPQHYKSETEKLKMHMNNLNAINKELIP